jgi:outer membrane protein insertion porin family
MKKTLNFIYIFLFFLVPATVFAATDLNSIIIKGNQRIDDPTILSYVKKDGLKNNNQEAINQSLKDLFGSDLFLDVKIYREKNQTIIDVKENPIVIDVHFKGNKKIDDDALSSEITLQKRSIYTKAKLQSDIKRLSNIYIKSGRFLTKIDPKIIKKDKNRIGLIFDINEGKKADIAKIFFIGNKAFSDGDLSSEITTKESKWYKFFSSGDSYDSDRIEFDKEKLRGFYTSQGYADFNTISAIAQITPKKDKFFITFLLEEGIKYNFGEVNIINNVNKFDESLLDKAIKIKVGKVYNAALVNDTVDKMVNIMSEKGYAFAHINPILRRNKEDKVIDIDFEIQETPRIYINHIDISGNTRTMDEVIRREMRVREGDAYNITKIDRSEQRIKNLGFFDKVEFKTTRISNSNLIDLEIIVKVKKTGELNFGIGYSTTDKATGNIGLKERNLLGTGQELGINFQKSSLRFSTEINYTKPYFTGRDIALGIDVFNYVLNKERTLVYDQKSGGAVIRGDYSIIEHLGHQIRYFVRDENISNVDDNASISLKNLEGAYLSSGVGQSFLYDKRDNRFDPREGYYFRFSQDYAGIGGDLEYLKNEGSAGYYIPILDNKDFVIKFAGKFGHIDGIGQDVRSNYNFFLGGNNFRGFEYAGIGPRAKINDSFIGGDAIGGKSYFVATTEMRFPLGLPKELGISGALFTDIGTLRGVDSINKISSDVADTGSLRASYGLSISWSSPMGPIRLDFSRNAKKEEFDRAENFRFSFGSNF